jgi:hypothetical protein
MDINGGQIGNQTAGNPIWPTTNFTGPITAGNVFHSDGSGNLAGLGETSGTANAGYVTMAQSGVVTQINGTPVPSIVIPAQSQIESIKLMVTTAWTAGATTFNIGTTGNATILTGNLTGNATALGQLSLTPGTVAAQIAAWDNVGNTDVSILATSGNTTGAGVGTLTVNYIQGINNQS